MERWFGLIELIFVYGLVFAFGWYQLRSVRKANEAAKATEEAKKRAAAAEPAAD